MTKRVAVSGCGGFVGAHVLAHILNTTDWDVIAIDSFRHKGKTDRIWQTMQGAPDGADWAARLTVITHDMAAPVTWQMANRMGEVNYFLALASESHVDRSISDPLPFVRNNTELIMNTLEFARQWAVEHTIVVSTDEVYGPVEADDMAGHTEWAPILPSNPYAASKAAQEALAIAWWRTYGVPLTIVNCFDMQTRVLTADGFKGHADLRMGDQVWALDAAGNMTLEPVQGLIRKAGPGTMVRVAGKGVSQLVTPDHRMMVQRSAGKPRRWQGIEETTAGQLVGIRGRMRIPRTGEWIGDDSPTIRPHDLVSPPGQRESRARGRGWSPSTLPTEMPTDQVAALFGWYISEGCTSRGTVRIAACSASQQETIMAWLSGIEGDRQPYVNADKAVCLAHGHLAALLDLVGKGSRNKRIPAFIKALAPKYLRVFFDAMVSGDGTRYGDGVAYYTTSSRLAQDVCEVGMKLGYAARISERETWNPAKTVRSRSFIVRLSHCAGEIESRNVTEEKYSGDVWCLSVPSGRVFVERDGIVSLSGQCMNMIGEMQDPEKFVPMLIKGISAGQPVTIHGTPDHIGTRHYLHARNLADSLVWLLQRGSPAMFPAHMAGMFGSEPADRPDRYNIVGPDRVDNLTLAKTIAAIIGEPLRYELQDFHTTRPGHDPHYGLDGTKITDLGWKPPMPFDASLEKTVMWTLRHPQWLL